MKSTVLLEKLTVPQLMKTHPTFNATQRFIIMLKKTHQLSLSWARLIQSMPSHTISFTSTLSLSSHPWPDIPSGLFPLRFIIKTLYAFLSPHLYMQHAMQSSFWIIFSEEYKSLTFHCECTYQNTHRNSFYISATQKTTAFLRHAA